MKKITPKILNQATAKDDFLEKKIREIVIERLEVKASEVTLEASFKEDLNADSLDRVELIMAFEEAFDIDIPDEAAEKIVTVGDAVKYIRANKN